MADDKPDDKSQEHDAALDKMADKLAKAAGSADVGALKEIVQGFYHDAVDLRAKNRELNGQLGELRKKLPKDGELVLAAADAKVYAEIQKTGIPLAELPKRLTEGEAAKVEVQSVRMDKTADEVAKLTGHNAPLLRSLTRLHKLNLQIQETADPNGATNPDGSKKKIRSAVVVPKGEDGKDAAPVPWDEYVEQNLGDFREALAGSEAERNGNREPPAGPRIVRQRSGELGPGAGVTDAAIAEEVRRRHPMLNGI
jgi:hypothetical protein